MIRPGLTFAIPAILISFLSMSVQAQPDSLRARIQHLVASAPGKTGVAVRILETNDTVSVNGDERFPTFSVYKFPIALAIMNTVDKGKLSLNQKIHVRKNDLMPDTWSPLRKKYPNGSERITIDTLICYTVAQSDNNGCDILLGLLGGTQIADQFVHKLGIDGTQIAATEKEMGRKEGAYLSNWSTPIAMTGLLNLFFEGSILSRSSSEYLWNIMVKTSTGPGRIKGLLPEGTVVAHKTGSSGTNGGETIATNDVGIMVLPDGKHIAISIFVKDAKAEETACEEVIARISRAVWDAYVHP